LKLYTAKNGLRQLQNLNQLHGTLCINDLSDVKDKTEAMGAMLNDKRHLEKLELAWFDLDKYRQSHEKALEGLDPHT